MIFEICAFVAIVIFAILSIYLIRTLLTVQKTLKQHTALTLHIDEKLRKMDSTFQAISNLGDISEEKTLQFRERMHHHRQYEFQQSDNNVEDLTTLLLVAIKLGSKFLKRKS